MRLLKSAIAGAITVSMLSGTAVMAAAPVRSAAALPTMQSAPVSGIRSTPPLKRKSNQSDDGTPAVGYGLAAIMAAGIVGAVIIGTDNDSDAPPGSAPSSPG